MARTTRRQRVLSVLSAVLATGALALVPTAARAVPAGALRLYVNANTGDDANACSGSAPCRTVQHAVDEAGTVPTVIVAAGRFFTSTTVRDGQHISVVGGVENGPPDFVSDSASAFTNAGVLSLSTLRLSGSGHAPVKQTSGDLTLTHVEVPSPSNPLEFTGGVVHLSQSDFNTDRTAGNPGAFAVSGATVLASHLHLGGSTVDVSDGALFADNLVFATGLSGMTVTGGSAQITDSSFSAIFDAVGVGGTGRARITRSTFSDNASSVAVDGAFASAVLVDDTFVSDRLGSQITNAGGTVELAATAVSNVHATPDVPLCTGVIVDGGYNRANDTSCGASQPTSRVFDDLLLHGPGGDSPTGTVYRAPQGDSPLVDVIPASAVAAFDPAVALCAGADQRGLPVPVASRCDVGSVELAPVDVAVAVDRHVLTFGTPVRVTAHVSQPAGATTPTQGVVQIGQVLANGQFLQRCTSKRIISSAPVACTFHPYPGTVHAAARFVPSSALRTATTSTILTVHRAVPTLQLSVNPAHPVAGRAFTLTLRTAKGALALTPRGTLHVRLVHRALPGCTQLHVRPSADRCTVTGLPSGTRSVVGSYPGDAYFAPTVVRLTFVVRAGRA